MSVQTVTLPFGQLALEEERTLVDGQSELLGVPLLIQHKIMSYLKDEPFALLTLREVCSTTKQWVTEFRGQEKAFKGFQATICQGEAKGWNTLEAFLNMELYVSYFNLEIDDVESFFQNPSMPQFMKIYGPGIKKLKVSNFNSCVMDCELDFYEALISLEEIEFGGIFVPVQMATEGSLPLKLPLPPRVPKTFENLKVLKLGLFFNTNKLETTYIVKLIDCCPNLDVLRLPDLRCTTFYYNLPSEEVVRQILEYPMKRQKNHPDRPNLRCFNLKYLAVNIHFTTSFLALAEFSSKRHNDIKLQDVPCVFLALIMEFDLWNEETMQFHRQNIAESVVSIIDMAPSMVRLYLPNLEKINIYSTSNSALEDFWEFDNRWNSLKTLKIHFDSDLSLDPPSDYEELDSLIFFLLARVTRPSCESLTLSWECLPQPQQEKHDDDFGTLKSRDIITNFPNLKKLKVVNWDAKNRKFIRLWNGLEHLEELCIENCPALGNVGFIGQNPDEPVFLKLKGLKKLTLKLDYMNKVTDRCFRDVFRHMKLKEFNLISHHPLEFVTIKGIEALLDGEFANSIEKFSFKTWSLENTSAEQFTEVEKKFRRVRW